MFALTAILIITLQVSRVANAAMQHGFAIEEYELFHEVLHPLQHEALPQGDFKRIRSMAKELVKRGKAIVKLGVPDAPKAERRKFAEARRRFDRALAAFESDAGTGSNSRLRRSFSAVHDSFEELADLVPTVYPGGMPPTVSLDCPASQLEAGSEIILHASVPEVGSFTFTWTIDRGTIAAGQGTPKMTIDTTGLAGQTISVTLMADDQLGHSVATQCKIQVAPGQ